MRLSWERPGRRLRPKVTLDADTEVAVAVTVGDGRTLLAVADEDGPPALVRLWDTATGEKVGEPLRYPANGAEAMVVLSTPGGTTLLAVAYRDDDGAMVQLWDAVSRERIGEPLPVRSTGPAWPWCRCRTAATCSPSSRTATVRSGSGIRPPASRCSVRCAPIRSRSNPICGRSRPRPRRTAGPCC